MLGRSFRRFSWKGLFDPLKDMDWWLAGAAIALTLLGGLLIRSTQLHTRVIGFEVSWLQHWVTGGVGLAFMFFLAYFRYDKLEQWPWIIYILTCASLLFVKFSGTSALGAQSWISIGGFNIQPSEFAKLGVIVVLAAVLGEDEAATIPSLIRALVILVIPWALVFIQPDLGTSLVFGAIALGMLYWANAKPGWIILMMSPLISAILFGMGTGKIWFFIPWFAWLGFMGVTAWRSLPWPRIGAFLAVALNSISGGLGNWAWTDVLQPHQRIRLVSFLDPTQDPLGSGYHLIQSSIAVGSGQLWGTGLNQGSQTQLEFIPEQHTDFIFSAVGEEMGFIGAMLVLLLFWLICLRLLIIAQNAKDNFGSLIAIGVLSMVLFQTFINVGMTIGVSPVTGIPLPWLSYGRSALLTNFIGLGLAESVANHRQRFRF